MNPFSLVWGVLIVVVGVLLLGINVGWWNESIWSVVWRFWPLVLILVGLRLLVRNSVAFFLIALGTLALIAWLLMMYAVSPMLTSASRNWDMPWQIGTAEPVQVSSFTSTQPVAADGAIKIALNGRYTITVEGTTGSEVAVDLTGPARAIERLELVKVGNEVVLREKTGMSWFLWTTREVIGTITLPQSTALNLDMSGASTVAVRKHTGNVRATNSGATNITFSESRSQDPAIEVSGVGKITLDACTGNAKFVVSGTGAIGAASCSLEKLTLDASGAAHIAITQGSIRDLTLSSSGAATIRLPRPTGKIEQDTSGASKIEYN